MDVPAQRARLETHVRDERRFLLCALLVQLWHLQWFVRPAFRARHLETRDHLLDRLLG